MSGGGAPILSLRDVHVAYGPSEVLHGVSLEVRAGEIVTLIGSNGAGKTTTLTTISGVHRPFRGAIEFEGERIDGRRPHEVVSRGLALVPEGRRIFPLLTVRENLEMGAFLVRDAARIRSGLERAFEWFPILRDRADQLGGTLSGGEQQMLAIARALMGGPRVLLLDEPSLGLAPIVVERIFDFIAGLRDAGTTILLVEQNALAALRLADRAYVLETGRVTCTGTGKDLLADPRIQEAYLGE